MCLSVAETAAADRGAVAFGSVRSVRGASAVTSNGQRATLGG
jgi:hypothetical protein